MRHWLWRYFRFSILIRYTLSSSRHESQSNLWPVLESEIRKAQSNSVEKIAPLEQNGSPSDWQLPLYLQINGNWVWVCRYSEKITSAKLSMDVYFLCKRIKFSLSKICSRQNECIIRFKIYSRNMEEPVCKNVGGHPVVAWAKMVEFFHDYFSTLLHCTLPV